MLRSLKRALLRGKALAGAEKARVAEALKKARALDTVVAMRQDGKPWNPRVDPARRRGGVHPLTLTIAQEGSSIAPAIAAATVCPSNRRSPGR